MSLRRSVGFVGISLIAGALLFGATPLVGADTTPVDKGNFDKYLGRATVLWQGVVVYQDETGKIVESGVLEVPSPCTIFFVSNVGHAVTAGHCFNVDQGRNALMQEFWSLRGDPATVPDMSERDVTILDVHGVMEDVNGTGSDPKPIVTVSQEAGIEGAVMGPGEVRRAHIIDTPLMERDDVALLQVDGLAPTPALPIALSAPSPGEAADVVGYPMEVTEGKASVNAGTVSTLHPSGKFGWPTIEIDAVMVPGMSGGPVIVNDRVVGTVSHPLPDGTNQATNTDSLQRILTRNNVPILDPAGTQATKAMLAANRLGTPGAFGIGTIIGLLVGMVVVKRKKKAIMDQPTTT